MTTKGPSQKQVIIPINNEVAKRYLKNVSTHIININYVLKNIKSNIITNFIHVDDKEIVITTNNVASPSNLQEIKKCIKNSLTNNMKQISSPRLLQSKLYLKIISILYISEHSNVQILSDEIKKILKNNHIFNDIVLAFKPRIIKILPKSDIAIVWIDIWDTQNGSNAKNNHQQTLQCGKLYCYSIRSKHELRSPTM